MSAPRTIAAIDAGSNAIRAVVGAVLGRNEWTVLESERIPVRLGHQAFTLGELDADTVDAAVAAFARFRKLFDYHRVERYRAVATSATRTVRNRELLLGRIFYETGIDIEVIDGEEEFRLVHVAVERAYGSAGTPGALLDLGGGSLEVGRKIEGEWQSVSMPIGTVRLMETFALTGAISEDEERLLRRYIGTNADSHGVGAWSLDSEHKAVVTGGNAEALARMFGTPSGGGAQTLTVAQLEQGLSRLLRLSVPERVTAYGIREDRAEVVAIAGLIFSEVVRRLDVQVLEVPGVGVRDGVMLELSGELSSEATEQSRQAALLGSMRVYMSRLGHDVGHGEQVRDLAVQLFDELRPVHGLDDEARLVLELAGLVHDVGEVVDRRAHHRHAEYLLMHGRIPGFDSPTREMVAALARAHRKSTPDPTKHAAFARLTPAQRDVVVRLVPLLRIADALDTDHRHLIAGVTAESDGEGYVLRLEPRSAGQVGPVEAFSRRNASFERLYGRPLRMVVG